MHVTCWKNKYSMNTFSKLLHSVTKHEFLDCMPNDVPKTALYNHVLLVADNQAKTFVGIGQYLLNAFYEFNKRIQKN